MTQFSHQHVLCTENNIIFIWIFSKLTYSFVAIEFLDSFKNAKFHLYCSRDILVFYLLKYILQTYKGFIFFLLLCILQRLAIKGILYKNINDITLVIKRQYANVFIYKKAENIAKGLCIYSKIQTICKNQDNFHYVFIHKNPDT